LVEVRVVLVLMMVCCGWGRLGDDCRSNDVAKIKKSKTQKKEKRKKSPGGGLPLMVVVAVVFVVVVVVDVVFVVDEH
jgi:cobalamin biosynthesis Mg chelatase CobN